MDNTHQNQQVQNQQNQTQQSSQGNTLVDFTQSQQNTGGSGYPKELEPMPSVSTATELMRPVEQHVELEPDVKEVGVETVIEDPQITKDVKDLGVEYAKETMPIEKELVSQNPFPLSQAQAQQILKGSLLNKNTSNPMIWLALLIVRQYQMLEQKEES